MGKGWKAGGKRSQSESRPGLNGAKGYECGGTCGRTTEQEEEVVNLKVSFGFYHAFKRLRVHIWDIKAQREAAKCVEYESASMAAKRGFENVMTGTDQAISV